MEQPQNSKRLFNDKKSKNIVVALLGVVLILLVFVFWQNNRFEEQLVLKTQFIEEKNTLRDNLDDLIDEHELLKEEYGEVSDQLMEKDSTIKAYAADIKNLLRTEGQLKEAKRKIGRLKEISRKYISAIDSLYTLNQLLSYENDSVKRANLLISSRNKTLEKKNQQLADRVSTASILQLGNISVEGVYYRTSGKEKITNKAAKVQNLRICFSVLENKVTEVGLKDCYVRIIAPNGSVLNVANQLLELSMADTTLLYTVVEVLDYQNQTVDHCLTWTRGNILSSGEYTFDFIVEEELIGSFTRKFH